MQPVELVLAWAWCCILFSPQCNRLAPLVTYKTLDEGHHIGCPACCKQVQGRHAETRPLDMTQEKLKDKVKLSCGNVCKTEQADLVEKQRRWCRVEHKHADDAVSINHLIGLQPLAN